MSSWGKTDSNTSAPKWATARVNVRQNANNTANLFNNTTANYWASTLADGSVRNNNITVGLFNVDAQETAVTEVTANTTGRPPHSGWVLRTVGSGGRAGRIQQETLVCLNSNIGDADGQTYANVYISLATSGNQTVNSNTSFTNVASFVVTPTLTGNTSAALTYNWQYNNSTGSYGWANIPANTTNIHFSGNNTATLYAMPGTTANNTNVFRVVVTAADEGVVATSANVSLSVPA
jgi:hypothetical protein